MQTHDKVDDVGTSRPEKGAPADSLWDEPLGFDPDPILVELADEFSRRSGRRDG